MTEKPSPELLRVAMEWLNEERARGHAEDWGRAVGFIVRCRYVENGVENVSLYGMFEDPVEAFRYAQKFQDELNTGLTEDQIDADGFRCDVFPLLPIDGS